MNRILAILLAVILSACTSISIPAQPPIGIASASPSPAIRSPTLPFVPTATFTLAGAGTSETGTFTPSYTPSPTSTPSVTPFPLLEIAGCNTSLDVTHGMGEVTNAYPLLKNIHSSDLTTVCVSLTASDEGRAHPDKTVCVDLLPAGWQVTLKLTVDTGFQVDTSIQITLTSQEGITASAEAPNCTDIGFPGWIPAEVGIIKPIP